MTGSRTLKYYAIALLCCGAYLSPGAGMAQTQPPEQFNGSSAPTGTQGVTGNPNCPPPTVYTANGTPVTPLNWSCDSSGYWPSRSPYTQAPVAVQHPGPTDPSDPNNPCLVQGHGYDWRNNPPGTYLPAGCERPANGARTVFAPPPPRGRYQTINPGFQGPPPTPPNETAPVSGSAGEFAGPNGEPLPAGQSSASDLPYRRAELPIGRMPPEIYIQRIPVMPAGRMSAGRW